MPTREDLTVRRYTAAAVAIGGLALLGPLAIALGTPPVPESDEGAVGHKKLPEQMTADHSKFRMLMQDFQTGPEVTATCLVCHTEAAKQVMRTSHWTWICPRAKAELASRQGRAVGKGEHVLNNFCIALASNEPRCTSCHAGYGWKDKRFDSTRCSG